MDEKEEKLKKELQSFNTVWQGGYCEGDPLDPMGCSSYGILGYMSVLHIIYLTCIKPYVNENSTVLEIGPGRGAWTKTFLHQRAKQIWCLDALSAEHNNFWKYVGQTEAVKYIHVNDFHCNELPDNHFNYLFSFGALCHVSFTGIAEYMKNIFPKLKKGSHCFIMVADYEKFNGAIDNINSLSALKALDFIMPAKHWKKRIFKYFIHKMSQRFIRLQNNLSRLDLMEDTIPKPSRWYHAGTKETCDLLNQIGYRVNDPDICVSNRDPIIHFSKP